MTNGIKEKDIRDMQKCFDKIETILKRIQVYNSEAKVICIESDTIALVNFNGEFIDSAPQIKDEYIVASKYINSSNICSDLY